MIDARTFLVRAIEVGIESQAQFFASLDIVQCQGMDLGTRIAGMQGATSATEVIGTRSVVFQGFVGLQDTVPAPIFSSGLFPIVIVIAMATDVNHGID